MKYRTRISLDRTKLPSGIYYYRLTAGETTKSGPQEHADKQPITTRGIDDLVAFGLVEPIGIAFQY